RSRLRRRCPPARPGCCRPRTGRAGQSLHPVSLRASRSHSRILANRLPGTIAARRDAGARASLRTASRAVCRSARRRARMRRSTTTTRPGVERGGTGRAAGMILGGFLGFTLLVAAITWLATRRHRVTSSPESYFLGGRSLSAWVIAGSLLLTNLSTEHLIGLNGDAVQHTIAVTAWETTAALAMVLTALVFLPRSLRAGLATIPDFLENRFDRPARVIMSLLFLISYATALQPVVQLFGASGLETLFDVSANLGISVSEARWLLIWGVGTLGSLYAIFGG